MAGLVWRCHMCSFESESTENACLHAEQTDHALYEIPEDTEVGKQSGWASRARRYVLTDGAGQAEVRERGRRAA